MGLSYFMDLNMFCLKTTNNKKYENMCWEPKYLLNNLIVWPKPKNNT
jgi:hypothetical protein